MVEWLSKKFSMYHSLSSLLENQWYPVQVELSEGHENAILNLEKFHIFKQKHNDLTILNDTIDKALREFTNKTSPGSKQKEATDIRVAPQLDKPVVLPPHQRIQDIDIGVPPEPLNLAPPDINFINPNRLVNNTEL
jgi:hypothetical protein